VPEYFTLAELRALPDVGATPDDDTVEAAAARVVSIIERVCQTSFISRTVTAERHDGGCYEIALKRPWILSVTSATENGVTVTDTLRVKDGLLRRYATGSYSPKPWLAGFDNITVTYAAGYSATPPGDIKDAALQATRYRLISKAPTASMNDRATSYSNEFGNVNLSVASDRAPFGLPDVDAVVLGWAAQTRPGLA
jgi:hypothetical protein